MNLWLHFVVVSNHSALVLTGNLFLLHRISLDYFYHHQVFVYMRANKSLFFMKLIMCEINSSRLVFLCHFVTVLCNKIH